MPLTVPHSPLSKDPPDDAVSWDLQILLEL